LDVANERLRGAIVDLGLTLDEVAERLGVSAKTVERWINDPERKPYRRFQYATASLLKCEVSYLWPDERTSAEVTATGNAELVRLYPHRSVVMQTLWTNLYSKATRQFDLLVYSGFWLTEDATFHRIVKEKAADGVPIRFMLGEPDSPAVAVRGEDEGIGAAMAGKIRNALVNYAPLFGLRGVEFRLHSTTLYNSIYRADDEMLANGHLYGVGAYMAPVLHLQRVPGGELFDAYAESVEKVWQSARPISSPTDWEGTR
jgi:transcriptional regulator with XRE-family HTH domain